MKYIFDIDGTLTFPRAKMSREIMRQFLEWSKDKEYYLITGSDFTKVLDQLPRMIMGNAKKLFCCLGNVEYTPIDNNNYTRDYSHVIQWPEEIIKTCNEYLANSKYTEAFGNHMEKRIGVLNVSTVGRNATPEERLKYFNWDMESKERETFAKLFNEKHKDFEASVGGMISIDITERGKNKAQILDKIEGEVVFFGDRIAEGGNDAPLANRIASEERGASHAVESPEETLDILKSEYNG